jgi:hypothetical protein
MSDVGGDGLNNETSLNNISKKYYYMIAINSSIIKKKEKR